ncbi:MAG: sugar phosphate nucleotidyltransferase [Candidatus Micrarchaeia archaeon]
MRRYELIIPRVLFVKKGRKEKIAISIDAGLLKRIDRMVDGLDVKSRSHALEMLIRKGLGEESVDEALLFAGGEGKHAAYRLPKPMLELYGRPVMQGVIEWLGKNGIKKITVSVGYLREEIESYFGNGAGFGVSIEYIREDEPVGTAGSLKLARGRFGKTFVALNSDVICDFDLKKMVEFHKDVGALATVALHESKDVHRYGTVALEGNWITKFVEKPEKGTEPSGIVNAGVYVFEPEIFNYTPDRGMLETDVFPFLAKKGLIAGYIFHGEWKDVEDVMREGKR